VTAPGHSGTPTPSTGAYWGLRVLESGLLLVSLAGIGLFAWSVVDIIGIGRAATPGDHVPASLWPGVILFVGAMIALEIVRVFLHRYRRDDGSPRGDARGVAAAATADLLSDLEGDAPSADTSADAGKV